MVELGEHLDVIAIVDEAAKIAVVVDLVVARLPRLVVTLLVVLDFDLLFLLLLALLRIRRRVSFVRRRSILVDDLYVGVRRWLALLLDISFDDAASSSN